MKKKRKGQVALEFLMTYGWAFLIILVVIGAFIYFDVLNPSRLVGESCTFPAGINCVDQIARNGAEDIEIILRNGFGNSIDVVDATIVYYNGADECEISHTFATAAWAHNQQKTLVFDMTDPSDPTSDCVLDEGDRLMGTVTFAYTPAGSSFARQVEGSVSIPVQP